MNAGEVLLGVVLATMFAAGWIEDRRERRRRARALRLESRLRALAMGTRAPVLGRPEDLGR